MTPFGARKASLTSAWPAATTLAGRRAVAVTVDEATEPLPRQVDEVGNGDPLPVIVVNVLKQLDEVGIKMGDGCLAAPSGSPSRAPESASTISGVSRPGLLAAVEMANAPVRSITG